jgi:hypothetical protein
MVDPELLRRGAMCEPRRATLPIHFRIEPMHYDRNRTHANGRDVTFDARLSIGV